MRLTHIFVFLVALCASPVLAENWAPASGRTPADVRPENPLAVAPGDNLLVQGAVAGDAPTTLVLRVDDGHSSGYATRVNEERLLPPGPFAWHIAMAGAKTSGGRLLDASDIRRIMLFEPNSAGLVRIDRLAIEAGAKLPEGAVGFSLGAPDAPVIAGLTRLSPGDPRILAGHPIAVRRPSPDPVVANGIIGLERLRLDWPRGKARISLWLEDVGEWEALPHPLRRRVRVNGLDIVDIRPTPQQWIAERYLAGRDREARPDDDAWTAFGRFRGGLVSQDIEVGGDGITIELAGDEAASTFLSAVVIEPAGSSAALDSVNEARRRWMIENFPVWQASETSVVTAPIFTRESDAASTPVKTTVTSGSGARLSFAVSGGPKGRAPEIEVEAPKLGDAQLELALYAAQRRLDRVGADSNLLIRTATLLRGDPSSLRIMPEEPRQYVAWAAAPVGAPPGIYRGSVIFALDRERVRVPLEVEVLPVDLPPPSSPAGFYLDEAPHLTWFEETRVDRDRQMSCDLKTLQRFGVLDDAPGLTTPDGAAGLQSFVADSARAKDFDLPAPWLAYTPLKRLLAAEGTSDAGAKVAAAMTALANAGLPAPVWALFDEPGNLGGGENGAAIAAAKLRAAVPGVKLAGQFNNPGDWRYLDAVDVAIVDPGFGVNVATIEKLRAMGRDPWLYNTGRPRFTAGVWLWLTHASRYLQWHARMPTADPYDPTDGREGDVQVFPPMPEICAPRQDIDVSLLDMAEGLVDQRWLQWLAARPEPEARALVQKIVHETPSDWPSASKDGAERAAASEKPFSKWHGA